MDKKNAISFSIAFCVDFSIRNENITSEECKTKNGLKYWVAKKSCHGQTLINGCSISDYPSNFEGL